LTLSFETIFCDDIRQEANGKYMLVGVYPIDLVPGPLPATFSLSMFVKVRGLIAGEHRFKAELFAPGEFKASVEGEGKNEEGPVILAMPGLAITVQRYGQIELRISFDDGPFEIAGILPVAPSASPSA